MKKIGFIVLFLMWPLSAVAVPRFIFAVNYFADSISTYRSDESGLLFHHVVTPVIKKPSSIVLRPDGKFLYVASQMLDEIAIYRVDAVAGTLVEIKDSPIPSGVRSVFQLGISPKGDLLYVPGRFTNNLMVYRIHADTGALTPLEKNNFPTHGERARFVEVTPNGRFVYVTSSYSNELAAFKVDNNSEVIEPVKGMPFAAIASPQNSIVHPSGQFLYVPNWQAARLSGYHIDPETGSLEPINNFSASTGVYPFGGSVDPAGKFLYVSNWATSDISGFRVDEQTGLLNAIEGMPVPAMGLSPVTVQMDRSGHYAYVPGYGSSTMTTFDVDQDTGILVNPRINMTLPGVRRLAILEGDGLVQIQSRWLITGDAKGNISSYRVDAESGMLGQGYKLDLGSSVTKIAVHDGKGLVFAAVQQGDSIEVLAIDATGRFTRSTQPALRPGGNIRDLAINQLGNYLYVSTESPAQMLVYELGAENKLKEIRRIELPADARPVRLVGTPEQRLNFLLDAAADRIFAYRYLEPNDPLTFELDRRGSPFAVGKGLADMVVDPSGLYGLLVQTDEASVAVYRMPRVWDPIKPISNSVIKVGKQPVAIAMHPRGQYAYVLDAGSNKIHQLRFNPANGGLVLEDWVAPVKGVPKGLAIDPTGRFAYLNYSSRGGITRYEIDVASGRLLYPKDLLDGSNLSDLKIVASIH